MIHQVGAGEAQESYLYFRLFPSYCLSCLVTFPAQQNRADFTFQSAGPQSLERGCPRPPVVSDTGFPRGRASVALSWHPKTTGMEWKVFPFLPFTYNFLERQNGLCRSESRMGQARVQMERGAVGEVSLSVVQESASAAAGLSWYYSNGIRQVEPRD